MFENSLRKHSQEGTKLRSETRPAFSTFEKNKCYVEGLWIPTLEVANESDLRAQDWLYSQRILLLAVGIWVFGQLCAFSQSWFSHLANGNGNSTYLLGIHGNEMIQISAWHINSLCVLAAAVVMRIILSYWLRIRENNIHSISIFYAIFCSLNIASTPLCSSPQWMKSNTQHFNK